MHSAFNLFVFPNSMFTPLLLLLFFIVLYIYIYIYIYIFYNEMAMGSPEK